MYYGKSVMLRSVLVLVLGVTLIGSLLVSAEVPQDELVIAQNQQPANFDPANAYNSTVNMVLLCAYDSLLEYKRGTTELRPSLATDWEVSEDAKDYTLWLREGVKFHDGTEFTAEDVKYAFDRAKALGVGIAADLTAYKETEIINDYKVKIRLSKSDATFFQLLGKVFIPNKDQLEKHAEEGDYGQTWLKENEAGTGPYELTEWRPEEVAEFEKFDDYWMGWEGNHVSKVTWRFIKEPSTARMLLEKGDIDLTNDIAIEALSTVDEAEDMYVMTFPTMSRYALYYNTQKGPLKNKKVRQALNYAYNYTAHNEQVMEGYAKRIKGPIPSNVPFHYEDVKVYHQDLEKAKELLAEAGYPGGGFKLDFAYLPVMNEQKGALTIFQTTCEKLGIEVEPRGMMWPTLVDTIKNEEKSPMVASVYTYPNYPDPHAYVYSQFHCKFVGDWTNYSWYCNEELSELLDKAVTTLDEDKRRKYYKEAQQIIQEEAPANFINRTVSRWSARSDVKGFEYTPAYHACANVYGIYKEE